MRLEIKSKGKAKETVYDKRMGALRIALHGTVRELCQNTNDNGEFIHVMWCDLL